MTKPFAQGIIFMLLTMVASPLLAERPVQAPETASHVVTGTVWKIFKHDGPSNVAYVIQVILEDVEKGEGCRKGEFLYAYAFQRKPNAPREPSAVGHSEIPKVGQRIKAWINRAGGQMEGIYPNWFKVLAPTKFSINDSDGTTVIDAADIRSYDWKTHTITLRKGLRDQLHTQFAGDLVGGHPFTLTNGKASYGGHFTTSLSSMSLDSIVINLCPLSDLKEDQIQITLGYPTSDVFTGDDLRKNQSVKDTLESLGKIR